MKTKILHGIYFCLSALLATGCVMNEPEGMAEGEGTTTAPGVKDGVTMRIIIPGPTDTPDGVQAENLNVESVRFFVFKAATGELVDKTGAIEITADNVQAEQAPAAGSHHPLQYVITVNTDLAIPVTMSQSTTYNVYAVLNEQMGGTNGNNKYTGVATTDLSDDLDKITNRQDLVNLMKQPLSYTFNAANFLPATQKDENGNDKPFQEPAFIMYGSADCTYTPGTKEFENPIVINNQGLDRTMAKVTIESISSGDVSTENVSTLFVTSMGFANVPKNVYIEGQATGIFWEESALSLDGELKDSESHSYKRNWYGNFRVDYTYTATLRQTIGGLYFQGDNKVNAQGNQAYTVFPARADNRNNNGSNKVQLNPGGEMVGDYEAGPASLLNGGEVDNTPYRDVNKGNTFDFIKLLTGDNILNATDPEIIGEPEINPTTTITPDTWSLKDGPSYYIPENISSNPTQLLITLSIGDPEIKLPSPEEVEEQCKDQWDEGGNWNNELETWLNNGDKITFTRTLFTDEEGNAILDNDKKEMYYYVNKEICDYAWREKTVTGEVENYYNGNTINVDEHSKSVTFRVNVAQNADANGTPLTGDDYSKVFRNHEYKIRIIANETTYKVIEDANKNGVASTRIFTPEELGLTIIREVKPIK